VVYEWRGIVQDVTAFTTEELAKDFASTEYKSGAGGEDTVTLWELNLRDSPTPDEVAVTAHTGTLVEADPNFAVQVDCLAEAVTRLGWAKNLKEKDQAERRLIQVVSEYQDWKEGEE